MIIYHSREALTARLAALLHVGRLGPRPDPARAREAVLAPDAYRAEGLWPMGLDERGHQVCAVGRASRPEVARRAFHGLAEVFGIDPAAYLLVAVGPAHAWNDLVSNTLRRLGLGRLGAHLERRLLARRWRPCLTAVQRARKQAAERIGPHRA